MNMRNVLGYCLILGMLFGCQSLQPTQEKVTETGQKIKVELKEAYKTIRDDYLGSTQGYREKIQEAEAAAFQYVEQSEYARHYDAFMPQIDSDPMMPEAYGYYFVKFQPFETSSEDQELLVVVQTGSLKVVYAQPFEISEGDPFYRYREILNEIQQGRGL